MQCDPREQFKCNAMTLKMIIFYAFSGIGLLYFSGHLLRFRPTISNWAFYLLVWLDNFVSTTTLALNGQYNTPLTCAIFNGNVESEMLLYMMPRKIILQHLIRHFVYVCMGVQR